MQVDVYLEFYEQVFHFILGECGKLSFFKCIETLSPLIDRHLRQIAAAAAAAEVALIGVPLITTGY